MKRALIAVVLLAALPARAHEVRPAFLRLQEDAPGEFSVLWKTPARGEARLALSPGFSGLIEAPTSVAVRLTEDASIQTWRLKALDPLRGQTLRIEGLEATMTDALVDVSFADGTTWTQRLTPARPAARIPERASALSVAATYLRLGVEHILGGTDHLLFVLSLMLVTAGWDLLRTASGFTLAHSITLALASLNVVRVPQQPVEAVIALSIVFVVAESVRARRGGAGVAARAPWVVAFIFGLLHGFGFAGALVEIGLPQARVPLALLSFNLGVEAGQLAFIAAVLLVLAAGRRFRLPLPSWAPDVPAYAIGLVATFWVAERLGAL